MAQLVRVAEKLSIRSAGRSLNTRPNETTMNYDLKALTSGYAALPLPLRSRLLLQQRRFAVPGLKESFGCQGAAIPLSHVPLLPAFHALLVDENTSDLLFWLCADQVSHGERLLSISRS